MAQNLAFTLVGSFGIFFIGIIVYFHDKQSVTNRLFFLMSLSAVFWALANYFSITVETAGVLLWIRWVLFFAVSMMANFFLFIYNFPERNSKLSFKYQALVIGGTAFVMMATLSRFVFSDYYIQNGNVIPVAGPLMPIFGITVLGYLIAGLILMIRKYAKARDIEKKQWRAVMFGVFTTFFLLIITNYLFVVFFNVTFFIKLGPLLMLPAIFGMGYALMKHRLLNAKAVATEILTFSILSIALLEVLMAESVWEIILRTGLFCLFFLFGAFLIRSVVREVEQREKLEVLSRDLATANEKLKELDHLKSEFLSFASHQIKAPLAVIKGYAALIYDGTYGEVSEKAKEGALKIKNSSDKLTKLVINFINIRKIEEGKMEYKFEKVNCFEMIVEIKDELEPLAKNKNLEYGLESVGSAIFINADAQSLRQVFQNLIENAVKYTDSGFVKVKIETRDGSMIFSVFDSGHGMSKELLTYLFEEFHRDKDEKKIEGSGLGLYIAKNIIEAHKGKIWAESEGEGRGSTFFVELPVLKNI